MCIRDSFWRYVKTKTVGKEPVGELRCADKFGQVVVSANNIAKLRYCATSFLVFLMMKRSKILILRFEIEDIRDRLKN